MPPHSVVSSSEIESPMWISENWYAFFVSISALVCIIISITLTILMCGCSGGANEKKMMQEKLDAATVPPPSPQVSVYVPSSSPNANVNVKQGSGVDGGSNKPPQPKKQHNLPPGATMALADSRCFDK